MTLPADRCRCHGEYEQRTCDRIERCARHVALRTDSPRRFVNQAALLCYSGYTFFIEAKPIDSRD